MEPGVAIVAINWTAKAVKAAQPAYYWKVATDLKHAVGNLDDAGADKLIRDKLGNWRFQKAFYHYYLKFIEQPPGLRERLCTAFGAMSLTSDDNSFRERLWKTSRLVDDLPFASLESLREFAVEYDEFIEPSSDYTIRRLERDQSAPIADGHSRYRLLRGDDPPEEKSDWFVLEDLMVEGLVAHLGIREFSDRTSFTLMEGGKELNVSHPGRFTSAVDETVHLIRRVFELADLDG